MPIEIPSLNLTALAPSLIVIVTALLLLLFDLGLTDKHILGYLALVGVALAFGVSIAMGMHPPQAFQSMVVSDGYALFFNLIFLVAAGLSLLVAIDYLERHDMQHGEYYALLLFSTSGMMLMAAATDLIVVFLALEIMSVSLYILAGFRRGQIASTEAAMKYFILGAFASAFFLYGAALTYGATGTTNLTKIGVWLSGSGVPQELDPLALVGLGLLLVGFAFKVAAVPFHMWVPDVYEGAPTPVTGYFSVGPKAAGFAALLRIFIFGFGQFTDLTTVFWILAVLTMTIGNILAIFQNNIKRMLAYSSIAHAGYILVALTTGGQGAVSSAVPAWT